MIIQVNGEEKECADGISLEQFLAENGYRKEQIAVEVNEVILPKAEYAGYILAPNDKLEVVAFVGGG